MTILRITIYFTIDMGNKTNLPTNPQAPKRGDRVKAKDIQQLAAQVKRLSRQGRDTHIGSFYRAPDSPFMPKLRGKKDDPQAYEIALAKGYVIERRIPDGQALIYHFPTGLVDDDDNPIYHDITDGQAIYVQVQVQEDGTIEEEPVVLVAEDELEGEHFRPEVFDFGGNAGTHNYKIAVFEIVDSKPKLKLYGAGDNVDHYDERVGMENLEVEEAGTIYRIGKTYDDASDKVQLRTLLQLDGEGEPVIKDDEVGTPPADSIRFRRIVDLGTDAEVHVSNQDGAILVRGNSYDEEVSDAHKVSITVKDGLVTDLTKIDATGWWGTISAMLGNGDLVYAVTFEDGILVSAVDYGGNVPGTEAAPGAVGAVVSG